MNQSESIDEIRGILRDSEDEIQRLMGDIKGKKIGPEQVSGHEMFIELDSKHLALQEDYKKVLKEKSDLEFSVKFANRKVKSLTSQLAEASNKKHRSKPEPSMKRVGLVLTLL